MDVSRDKSMTERCNDDDGSMPIVFQCASCRVIVGDSVSFVAGEEDSRKIILSGASNVQVLHQKTDPGDLAAQSTVICGACKVPIGKLVQKDSRQLFAFHGDSIIGYEVGSNSVEVQYLEKQQVTADTQCYLNTATSPTTGELASELRRCQSIFEADIASLREDMTKVFSMILLLDERTSAMESNKENSCKTLPSSNDLSM